MGSTPVVLTGSLVTGVSRQYRGDQLTSTGTPAATTVTEVVRAQGWSKTTTYPDTAPASSSTSWNGLTYEHFDGSSGGTVRYDYTRFKEPKGVQDQRTGSWSLTTFVSV